MTQEHESNRGFVLVISFIISAFIVSMIVIKYDLWPELNNSFCDGEIKQGSIKAKECLPGGGS